MKKFDKEQLKEITGGMPLENAMIGAFVGIATAAVGRLLIGCYVTHCNNKPYRDAYHQGYEQGYASATVSIKEVILTFNDGFREGLADGKAYRRTHFVEEQLPEPSAPPMPIPIATAYPV